MRNIVGQTPRGDDFFPRDLIINKLYRRFESGSNVFMAAPRRVGKTAIMKFLSDNPREDYHFIYIMTESIDSSERFFKKALEMLVKSEALNTIAKVSAQTKGMLADILNRIKSVNLLEVGIELSDAKPVNFGQEFTNMLAKLETKGHRVVIMFDEFPQTVKNIIEKEDSQAAVNFLQFNRTLRQESAEKIMFLYTGSIGLPAVVKEVGQLSLINDLNPVEVPPLSAEEAAKMIQQLLKPTGIAYQTEGINELVNRIQWAAPFYIQLAIQEIIDVTENGILQLDSTVIEAAFNQMLNLRNNIYFDSYYTRLKEAHQGEELKFVLEVLHKLANDHKMDHAEIAGLANQFGLIESYQRILDSLEFDGYTFWEEQSGTLVFLSPILKMWWKKYRY